MVGLGRMLVQSKVGIAVDAPAAFKSATIPLDRLLPGIHGLRGIAALSVVLFHLVHIGNIAVPSAFAFIASDFGKGVHLFFVLSAFSLMHSTEHTMHRPTWATEYFVKRFFRIAPLFYCILAGMVLWPVIKHHAPMVNLQTLLLNLTFTFGFAPWSGIVWAGWTVGVEMLFYAILPILLLTVRSRFSTLLLVVVSIIATYAARSVLHTHYENTVPQYGYNWAYFSFASNLCFFAMGMYAFRLARNMEQASSSIRWIIPMFSLGLLGILLLTAFDTPLKSWWKADLILWGVGFTGLCVWQSTWPSGWSANRFFEHLGERSYSLYLLHPIVIVLLKNPIQSSYGVLTTHLGGYAFFICAVMVLVPLLLLSELSYRMIEVPGIKLGQRINRRVRAQGAGQRIVSAG